MAAFSLIQTKLGGIDVEYPGHHRFAVTVVFVGRSHLKVDVSLDERRIDGLEELGLLGVALGFIPGYIAAGKVAFAGRNDQVRAVFYRNSQFVKLAIPLRGVRLKAKQVVG